MTNPTPFSFSYSKSSSDAQPVYSKNKNRLDEQLLIEQGIPHRQVRYFMEIQQCLSLESLAVLKTIPLILIIAPLSNRKELFDYFQKKEWTQIQQVDFTSFLKEDSPLSAEGKKEFVCAVMELTTKASFHKIIQRLIHFQPSAFKTGNLPLTDVFVSNPIRKKEGVFITYCRKKGKRNLSDLRLHDFMKEIRLNSISSMQEHLKRYLDTIDPEVMFEGLDQIPEGTAKSHDKFQQQHFQLFKKEISQLKEQSIYFVYSEHKKGLELMKHFESLNKKRMMDLNSTDFDTLPETFTRSERKLFRDIFDHYYRFENWLGLFEKAFWFVLKDQELKELPIEVFYSSLPKGKKITEILHSLGRHTLGDIHLSDFSSVHWRNNLHPLGIDAFNLLLTAHHHQTTKPNGFNSLKMASALFKESLEKLSPNTLSILKERSRGKTLEAIAQEWQFTRERVRQIYAQTTHKLSNIAEVVLKGLVAEENSPLSKNSIQNHWKDEELASLWLMVMKKENKIKQLSSTQYYIQSTDYPTFEKKLKPELLKLVGEESFLYQIEEELPKIFDAVGWSHSTEEDRLEYLQSIGYRFSGDYCSLSRIKYSKICAEVIRRYFEFDIKLDTNPENEDILKIRNIVKKRYPETELPLENRALIGRLTTELVQSGRGRYAPLEKIKIDSSVLSEIMDYLINSKGKTHYFAQLYGVFEERLLQDSNIRNHYGLHGVLKHYYGEQLNITRDTVTLKGVETIRLDKQIREYFKKQNRPITIKDIQNNPDFKHINSFHLSQLLAQKQGYVQWAHGAYRHMEDVNLSPEEVHQIKEFMEGVLTKYNGYIHRKPLLEEANQHFPELMSRLGISNSKGFIEISKYYLDTVYHFDVNQVYTHAFSPVKLSNQEIIQRFYSYDEELNFETYRQVTLRLGWEQYNAMYTLFEDLREDYIQLDKDRYIRKDLLPFTQEDRRALTAFIQHHLHNGYCSLNFLPPMENLSSTTLTWTIPLIVNLIQEGYLNFRLLTPHQFTQRYPRGLIVPQNSPYQSFHEVVIDQLRQHPQTVLDEAEFLYFLTSQKIEHYLLSEIEQYDEIKKVDDLYIFDEKRTSKVQKESL